MDLDFTEAQEMLRTSAKDFLSKECPKTKIRELEESETGHDPELWQKMAELGWLGLVFPEEYGGTGGEFLDLAILLEEMGRNILPGPFSSTVVDCSMPILQYGSEEQKKEFLPKVAEGKMILALALIEPSGTYRASGIRLKATPEGENYILEGTKLFVLDAKVADYLLVAARTSEGAKPEDGITMFLVDAKSSGIKSEEIPTTGMDKQCEVNFSKVSVPKKNALGEVDKGWDIVGFIIERASILKAAEMLGSCEASVEMANSYAKERVQYGRPIGDFQVIQHYLVNIWMQTELLRSLVYPVAWRVGEGLPSARETSIAKAFASESFKFVTERAVQVHGAIGTTRDHDMGLYYRRAWAWDHMFGNAAFHRDRIAEIIGL
jgi:alkylation response protein AidB-like acyl-CoA dehydrogenase